MSTWFRLLIICAALLGTCSCGSPSQTETPSSKSAPKIEDSTNITFSTKLQSDYDSMQQYECAAVPHSKFGDPMMKTKTPGELFDLTHDFSDSQYDFEKPERLDFWIWQNGTNNYYCLGFSESGELIQKSTGRRKRK